MDSTVLVAVLSLVGTLGGSLFGILAANKLVNYRIQQLEAKVEKHNRVIERVYNLEKHEELVDERIRNIDDQIEHLEGFHQ
jgi:cell division protein FtsB